MRYRDAKKLRNGDEVILKDNFETVQILDAWTEDAWPGVVFIELVSNQYGWQQVTHQEVL